MKFNILMFLICVYHFMLSYLWFFGRAPFTIQLIKINRNLNNRSTKKMMWLVELCMHYISISHSDSWFNCTNHLSIRWLIKIGDRVIRRTPCSIRIRAMTDIWVTQTNSVWNTRGSHERKREAQRIWTSALRAGKESERARLMCVVCVCVGSSWSCAHTIDGFTCKSYLSFSLIQKWANSAAVSMEAPRLSENSCPHRHSWLWWYDVKTLFWTIDMVFSNASRHTMYLWINLIL